MTIRSSREVETWINGIVLALAAYFVELDADDERDPARIRDAEPQPRPNRAVERIVSP